MTLLIILLRHNCHLLTISGFELLRNVCYSKFLLMVFEVSFYHQALISCGAKRYFSKLGYQLFLVQCFWKKLKTINFKFFSHSWSLKCRTFLEWLFKIMYKCFVAIQFSINLKRGILLSQAFPILQFLQKKLPQCITSYLVEIGKMLFLLFTM